MAFTSTTAPANAAATARSQATTLLCAKHFHQSFWLPQTAAHDRLRVTFATTSNFSDTSLPVILFCGPMFGSRWGAVDFDSLAGKKGVRCICVDRPGIGGSTPVSTLSLRIPLWLEVVPALLAHLGIKHISCLMSHSAGTLYALNTMHQLRQILDPENALVALIAPWVHNEHSQATLMNLAAKLPDAVVRALEPLMRFTNSKVVPVTSWSGGLLSNVGGIFSSSEDKVEREEAGLGDGGLKAGLRYGVSEDVGKEVEGLLYRKYLMAEDTSAFNEEALLCLKKGGLGSWGVAEDYEDFVRNFVEQEKERRREQDGEGRAKLRIHAYFGETDIMIGKGGQKYFEQCWRQGGVNEEVEFESIELEGTNHDTIIIDRRKGALGRIFGIVGGRGVEG